MRSRRAGIVFLLLVALAGVVGWFVLTRQVERPQTLELQRATFADLPGWNGSDPASALAAFRRSCAALQSHPADEQMSSYGGQLRDWRAVCADAQNVEANAARAFFEARFVPFAIVGDALFTGYYEPLLHGSRMRHAQFQTPVYALPSDLVSVELGAFRPELKGEHISGRLDGQHLVPYATRADIDAVAPPAKVIFYCDDPVAVFFLHIQGSGRVQLDDGSTIRVSYAGQNGQPYTPIGRTLVRSGALSRDDLSMQGIRVWLKSHPGEARKVMESDESYIFFRETAVGDPALGSAGAGDAALTPTASIAVDLRIHGLGTPFFINTTTPDGKPLQKLFIAQDTGGAIRGPARADIYFGFGARAEELAGGMKASGQLYVLLPNAVAATVAP